jgi:hypothetical protein
MIRGLLPLVTMPSFRFPLAQRNTTPPGEPSRLTPLGQDSVTWTMSPKPVRFGGYMGEPSHDPERSNEYQEGKRFVFLAGGLKPPVEAPEDEADGFTEDPFDRRDEVGADPPAAKTVDEEAEAEDDGWDPAWGRNPYQSWSGTDNNAGNDRNNDPLDLDRQPDNRLEMDEDELLEEVKAALSAGVRYNTIVNNQTALTMALREDKLQVGDFLINRFSEDAAFLNTMTGGSPKQSALDVLIEKTGYFARQSEDWQHGEFRALMSTMLDIPEVRRKVDKGRPYSALHQAIEHISPEAVRLLLKFPPDSIGLTEKSGTHWGSNPYTRETYQELTPLQMTKEMIKDLRFLDEAQAEQMREPDFNFEAYLDYQGMMADLLNIWNQLLDKTNARKKRPRRPDSLTT